MINAVIARLKDRAPELADVLPAEDVDAIGKGPAPRNGTVFVLPYREQAEPNELAMGGFEQRVLVQILTAFVVRRHDDAKGGRRVLDFDAIKAAIEGAIAGWAVSPGNDLFELVAGQAGSLGNGVSIYVQTWQTSRVLEA
ncbi:phage tail terminator protein [Ensifer soli]|uniref:phage tail terminator protein n=1 Tax=Ciceribacter sp. sgz301302 TaxID=3342379 RepID=UPI0035B8207F